MVCYNDAGAVEHELIGHIDLVRDDALIINALGMIWTDALERTTMIPEVWQVLPQPTGEVSYSLDEKPTAFTAVGNRQYRRRYRIGHTIAGSLLLEYMSGKNLYVRTWGIRSGYITEVQNELAAILNIGDGFAYPYDKERIGKVIFDYLEQSHIPKMILDENKTSPENIKGTVIQNILACCRAFLSGFFSIFKRGK